MCGVVLGWGEIEVGEVLLVEGKVVVGWGGLFGVMEEPPSLCLSPVGGEIGVSCVFFPVGGEIGMCGVSPGGGEIGMCGVSPGGGEIGVCGVFSLGGERLG